MSRWVLANFSKNWGGGEKWTLTTAQALQQSGHHAHLIVYPGSHLAVQAAQLGLPCLSIKACAFSLFNPLKVLTLFRCFQSNSFDAVILNASHELKFIGLIAKFASIPRIIFRRGIPQPLQAHVINRWYLKYVVNCVIVNSKATLLAMESVFSHELSRLPVQVIYNGLDLQLWKSDYDKQDSSIIGVVGRLSYEKGIDRALYVFAQVNKKLPATQLWIVGQGEEQENLEKIATELGILDCSRFTGFTENVRQYMQKMDILLFPSRWEGFGYVLLEAMSLEVPPVAFDIGAAKEIITEDTGVLVPDGEITACANEVINLLQDRPLRKQMGKNARCHVKEKFSLFRVVEQLEKLLLISES
ncbi:MAG: glycosyltransferase family 4 protein [SAR324 cluster bacterium]|nr:glycosyltransferase family 4 protein [SAR324 cluster bacterium]